METPFDQARAAFLAGVQHYEAGRYEEAETSFSAALALVPGRPSALANRGAARLKLGLPHEALDDLRRALQQQPDNAEALGHCGTALAELGRPEEALPYFERAVVAQPASAALWLLRGTALRELGRGDDAATCFRQSLAHGGDAELIAFYLASLEGGPVPPTAPRGYVEALFDGYAEGFDQHLVQALQYDAPRRLLAPFSAAGRPFTHALDLGCGTGLCGPGLRRLAAQVTGIDLSQNMLDRAAATGAYDTLAQADAVAWLRAAEGPFDLVVAADVFIYLGALDEVFAELARLQPAGAAFCFSVEEATGGAALELRASLRYAHSAASIEELAARHGWRIVSTERHPVRVEAAGPIPGLFCWLERLAV